MAYGSLFLPTFPNDFSAFLASLVASFAPASLAMVLHVLPSLFFGLGLQPV